MKLEDINNFLQLIREHTSKPLEVLLLGGEPTMLSQDKLIAIASLITEHGFVPIISSNGFFIDKIIALLDYYRWIQVTVYNDSQIDFYRKYKDKINIKLSGDDKLTLQSFNHFVDYTEWFERRSISMYSTSDFVELCTDSDVWAILDRLHWERNGSYLYAFYKGVRIKRFIKGETNIIDEPTVPKLYPNGNYNKTWRNEELDDYLGGNWANDRLL